MTHNAVLQGDGMCSTWASTHMLLRMIKLSVSGSCRIYKHMLCNTTRRFCMSVYICRHADRQSTHPMSALSQMGKTNAVALGQTLASNGMREPCILSSPYERCLETATAISRTVGRVPILVEYGLSDGPIQPGAVGVCVPLMQQRFGLLDTRYKSKTPLPNHEDTQRHVLPRCVNMGRFVSDFYMNQPANTDVVVVTHGTVAMGIVAAMAQKQYESLDDSLEHVQGCVAAGYYKLVPYNHQEGGLAWSSDYVCNSSVPLGGFPEHDTKTTPTCYIPGPM